jgi:hypothetical protein
MAAKRKSRKKTPQEFWTKVLAAPKVKRILEKHGIKPDAFQRDYEADSSRGPRAPKRPTRAQIDAVEAFQKTGDFESFKKSLSTTSSTVANSALRRVVQFKAIGGTKPPRRRGGAGEG